MSNRDREGLVSRAKRTMGSERALFPACGGGATLPVRANQSQVRQTESCFGPDLRRQGVERERATPGSRVGHELTTD